MTWSIMSPGLRTPICQPIKDSEFPYACFRRRTVRKPDANLAASDTLGLPRCQTPDTPTDCVAQDGSMRDATANLFIGNMNAYDHGAGYLGQTNWHLPPV